MRRCNHYRMEKLPYCFPIINMARECHVMMRIQTWPQSWVWKAGVVYHYKYQEEGKKKKINIINQLWWWGSRQKQSVPCGFLSLLNPSEILRPCFYAVMAKKHVLWRNSGADRWVATSTGIKAGAHVGEPPNILKVSSSPGWVTCADKPREGTHLARESLHCQK